MKFRDVEDLIEKAGLMVISVERQSHFKARVRAPDGRESVQVISCTPSDRRALMNIRADLRRFARGPAS